MTLAFLLCCALVAAQPDAHPKPILRKSASTRLFVRTIPKGASIYLDGKELPAKTDGLLLIREGVHRVTLDLEGYDVVDLEIPVRKGRITRIEKQLQAVPVKPEGATPPAEESDASSGAIVDGFEGELEPDWQVYYAQPTQPHGKVYHTEQHVRSGRRAVALEQAPGQHSTGLEREFSGGFQGKLTVWLLLVERDLPPGTRRDIREGAHPAFIVDDDTDQRYTIALVDRSASLELNSRAQGPGGRDNEIREAPVARGWHELTIHVTPDGTTGMLDGKPLTARHPTLTACHKIRLQLGWSCGGIAVWDDFHCVPE
jgi:hypothetical protein